MKGFVMATITAGLKDSPQLNPAAVQAGVRATLEAIYEPILSDLGRVERLIRDTLDSDSDFIAELVKRVQLYGGKRMRPAMLLLAAKACGVVTPDHDKLAACIELIHVATLVHDDVLDDADKRRHVATVNAEWGTEASLLLGDFLFTHAFQLAAAASSLDACRMLGRSTNKLCAGELHQVSRRGRFDLSEEEYLEVLTGKTAELFACACGIGAHYSNAPPAWEAALTDYGRNLGVAFQIADDVIDLLGEEAVVGKPIGSDLRKQKMTLPLIRLRETGDAETVDRLRRRFDDPEGLSAEPIAELLRGTDALEYTHRRGLEFLEAAADALGRIPDSPSRESLLKLKDFALSRTA
jgi:octaprenyl-diphosphate synthase